MLNTQTIKSLTDLRSNPLLVSQLARDEGPVYILNRNKPISVIIDIQEFESLIDHLEDAWDALYMRTYEKRLKNKKSWLTLEEVAKKYDLKI